MTYVNASLPKKRGPVGAPKPKNPTIVLINTRDVETFPDRDSKGVKITDDVILKTGKKAIGIYATSTSISRGRATEGEVDAEGFVDTLIFAHPGNSLELDEFIQNNLGEDFLAITRECGDGKGVLLHGSPCNPMKFNVESQDDSEAVRSTFTFTTPLPSNQVAAHYFGDIPAIADAADEGSSGGGI